MNPFGGLGSLISSAGHAIGAPDLGIGKFLGSTSSLPGALQGVNPSTYQGVGVVSPNSHFGGNSPSVANYAPASQPSAAAATSGGGGGSSSPYGSSSYWNQLIGENQAAIGQLGAQAGIGHNNIAQQYNGAYQGLLGDQNTATHQYQQDVNNNQNNNVYAKNNIDQGVHNTVTGLQRLLGLNGAGDSSAALITAPYAAAQQGNQQRNDVQQQYGQNEQSLDSNWTGTQNKFKNAFGDLLNQKAQQDTALDQGLAQTHQQLLQQEQMERNYAGQGADPSLGAQINNLGAQITQLGAKPTFTPQAVTYAAPNLAAYNMQNLQGPTQAAAANPDQASAINNAGAYYNLLTDPNKQKQAAGATT